MKKSQLRHLIREEIKNINESFSTSDSAETIFQDIDKKYDYLQLNAETFPKIHKALLATGDDIFPRFKDITRSRKYNRKLEKDWTSVWKDTRFYFEGDKIVSILNRQPNRENYTTWEYNDGEWLRSNSAQEDHFMGKYSDNFKEGIYIIYDYRDHNMGFGKGTTQAYVRARNESEAFQKGKAINKQVQKGYSGIDRLSEEEFQQEISNAKGKISYYTKLLKQLNSV